MKRSSLEVLDLFSGAGGFSIGFRDSGFKIKVAVDNDRAAAKTYVGNFPETLVIAEDIRRLRCRDFKALLGEEVPIIIGSPPCEPYTGANPNRLKEPLDRLYKDPVGSLVLEFIRVVECLRPLAFVMENVPALAEGELKDALRSEFSRAGYDIYLNILRAEDFGTPSHRVRLFISNIKLKLEKSSRKITVEEALKGLPEPTHDPLIPNHDPPQHLSKSKLKRAYRVRWGGSVITYEGAEGRRLPNLIRLHPYRLAPTVLGSSRFLHPFEDRLLTVREQARLMGFPDNHVFLGGKDQQYNQVGEAVPPPLARAIAQYLLTNLEVS